MSKNEFNECDFNLDYSIEKALYERRSELSYIADKLGRSELLAQLAEEAAELSHAALKLRRVLDGKNPTPVLEGEAERDLHEEIADVLLCAATVGINKIVARAFVSAKSECWFVRMKGEKN